MKIEDRIKQLEHQHDVQRPTHWGAQWRQSLNICNELLSQRDRLLAALKEAHESMNNSRCQGCDKIGRECFSKLVINISNHAALIREIEEGE